MATSPQRRCAGRSAAGAHLVTQRTRLKNQVQWILRNLVPRLPVADLFGSRVAAGWPTSRCPRMRNQEALLRQLNFHGQELRIIDATLPGSHRSTARVVDCWPWGQ
jgi:hypothetical protein